LWPSYYYNYFPTYSYYDDPYYYADDIYYNDLPITAPIIEGANVKPSTQTRMSSSIQTGTNLDLLTLMIVVGIAVFLFSQK
jgi:hypothetical protein